MSCQAHFAPTGLQESYPHPQTPFLSVCSCEILPPGGGTLREWVLKVGRVANEALP